MHARLCYLQFTEHRFDEDLDEAHRKESIEKVAIQIFSLLAVLNVLPAIVY